MLKTKQRQLHICREMPLTDIKVTTKVVKIFFEIKSDIEHLTPKI